MKSLLKLILLLLVLGIGYYFWYGELPTKNNLDIHLPDLKQDISEGVREIKETIQTAKEEPNQKSISENNTQQQFLQARGIPGIFVILFSDAMLDDTGKPIQRPKPIRAETWTFGAPHNVISTFENNFFIQEESSNQTAELMSHSINPLSFTFDTTQSDIKELLGPPDCQTEADGGSHTIHTLKYQETTNRPYATVSFRDDQIMSVTVGIAFSESKQLCP